VNAFNLVENLYVTLVRYEAHHSHLFICSFLEIVKQLDDYMIFVSCHLGHATSGRSHSAF